MPASPGARRSDPALSDDRPIVRLSRPAELVALVPQLCGFVPHESLTVVCLRGRRSRVGLTMRVDLPDDRHGAALAGQLVERILLDGATRVLLVVHTEQPDAAAGELPGRGLVDRLAERLDRAGLRATDRLLVRSGRWWSYDCDDERCCPAAGTPLHPEPTPALQLVAAQQALDGRAVLPSREELVASLAAPAPGPLRDALAAAESDRRRQVAERGRAVAGRASLLLWREVLADDAALSGALDPAVAAGLVVSLADVLVRDAVLTWAVDQEERLLALLVHLAGRCAAPHDVPVCTLVAWVAHVRGSGALANVALDRALAADPDAGLAGLGRQALDAQVPPSDVRALLVDARALLSRQHPWTRVG